MGCFGKDATGWTKIMGMRAVLKAALLAPLVFAAAAQSTEVERVAEDRHVVLHVEEPGKFEVLHSRARSTSTGAVLFGLIGAGIEESARKSDDEEKESAVLAHIPDDACHSYLIDTFTKELEERGFAVTVVEGKPGKSSGESYVIRLKIDACGYRMVDTINEEMAAYVTAQYRIFRPQEELKGKLLELTIISRNQRTWDDLTADFDSAVEEFRDVKRRVGTRLANKLVYLK